MTISLTPWRDREDAVTRLMGKPWREKGRKLYGKPESDGNGLSPH